MNAQTSVSNENVQLSEEEIFDFYVNVLGFSEGEARVMLGFLRGESFDDAGGGTREINMLDTNERPLVVNSA